MLYNGIRGVRWLGVVILLFKKVYILHLFFDGNKFFKKKGWTNSTKCSPLYSPPSPPPHTHTYIQLPIMCSVRSFLFVREGGRDMKFMSSRFSHREPQTQTRTTHIFLKTLENNTHRGKNIIIKWTTIFGTRPSSFVGQKVKDVST